MQIDIETRGDGPRRRYGWRISDRGESLDSGESRSVSAAIDDAEASARFKGEPEEIRLDGALIGWTD